MEAKAVSVYSLDVYRAVCDHYFWNVAEPDWAPASLILTTLLLHRQLSIRWRWFVVGLSLLVIGLLLEQAGSLRHLAIILD